MIANGEFHMPKRIQRRRTNGWKMPEGAVYVGRPTIYGNPFPNAGQFRRWLTSNDNGDLGNEIRRAAVLSGISMLRGKDLACWCSLCPDHREGLRLGMKCIFCTPCHADVLLEIANAT